MKRKRAITKKLTKKQTTKRQKRVKAGSFVSPSGFISIRLGRSDVERFDKWAKASSHNKKILKMGGVHYLPIYAECSTSETRMVAFRRAVDIIIGKHWPPPEPEFDESEDE